LHPIVLIMYNECMTSDKKDTQINIRISSELLDALRLIAEEEVTTTSQLVRKSITLLVRDRERRNNSV
jgi:predicted DNA binding CopG/RHH family protein